MFRCFALLIVATLIAGCETGQDKTLEQNLVRVAYPVSAEGRTTAEKFLGIALVRRRGNTIIVHNDDGLACHGLYPYLVVQEKERVPIVGELLCEDSRTGTWSATVGLSGGIGEAELAGETFDVRIGKARFIRPDS